MPIFRYTTKKMLVSPSTWIIFIIGVLILGLAWSLPIIFGGGLAGIILNIDLVLDYYLLGWKYITFTVFISLALLIFITVKATQIFRDEIEDGTLLILVSKPISRNRIWAEKWFSFQAIIIGYSFFTILLAGIPLLLFGTKIYLAFLPYMAILFGIVLILDLIFSSIILLLSLVLNGKATIAVGITFAALLIIFSQAVEKWTYIPSNYFVMSQAVGVFHDIEKKVNQEDIDWLKFQVNNNNYSSDIDELIKKVYENDIPGVEYPNFDPVKEQEVFNAIKNNPEGYNYTDDEVILITRIVNISNAFLKSANQTYFYLMLDDTYINYNVSKMLKGLGFSISQDDLDIIDKKVFQKKLMRYLNIFYQLYYLSDSLWGGNNDLYVAEYKYESANDPYLITFNKIGEKYQVDINSGYHKIINFTALISVYLLLGLTLLGTSWYVFNRRDFA